MWFKWDKDSRLEVVGGQRQLGDEFTCSEVVNLKRKYFFVRWKAMLDINQYM